MLHTLNVKSTATKVILLGCLALLAIPGVQADEVTDGGELAGADNLSVEARLLAGQKRLDDDWASMDSQGEIGVLLDVKKEGWPVSIAIDLIGSGDSASSSNPEIKSGYTVEQHLGIRKTWTGGKGNVHRYVGGGLALIHGGLEQRTEAGGDKQDDNAFGTWVAAGAYWDLNDKFSLGFDVRYSQADIDLFGRDIKAGGVHNNITLGYRF